MAELSKSELEHKDMRNAIAALSMDAVQAANSGHPGMPMGSHDNGTDKAFPATRLHHCRAS